VGWLFSIFTFFFKKWLDLIWTGFKAAEEKEKICFALNEPGQKPWG
jgi:hypothetical protein